MPSERRKEQNRINQRRYRMQIKNRIQMLEKVIIAARAPDGNLGTETSLHSDQPPCSNEAEIDMPISQFDFQTEQDLESWWNLEQNPLQFENGAAFMYQNTSASWIAPEMGSFSGTDAGSESYTQMYTPSPLSTSTMDFGSQNYFSPSSETSPICFDLGQSQGLPVPPLIPHSGDSIDESIFQNSGPMIQKHARGRPRKKDQIANTIEPETTKRPTQKKYNKDNERTIASLRAENKRLEELCAALVNMYDLTKTPSTQNRQHELDMMTSQSPVSNMNYHDLTSYNSPIECSLNPEDLQLEVLAEGSPVAIDPSECPGLYQGFAEGDTLTSELFQNQPLHFDVTGLLNAGEQASHQFPRSSRDGVSKKDKNIDAGKGNAKEKKSKAAFLPYGTHWDPAQSGGPNAEEVLRACFEMVEMRM